MKTQLEQAKQVKLNAVDHTLTDTEGCLSASKIFL